MYDGWCNSFSDTSVLSHCKNKAHKTMHFPTVFIHLCRLPLTLTLKLPCLLNRKVDVAGMIRAFDMELERIGCTLHVCPLLQMDHQGLDSVPMQVHRDGDMFVHILTSKVSLDKRISRFHKKSII